MKILKRPTPNSQSGFIETLLLYAVLFVVSELLRPKPDVENAKPAGLGDFRFPTATEDRVVPILWGTVRIEGPNVVWYGDLIQDAIEEEIKTGLFSSVTQIRGYQYSLGIQFAICRGPDVKLLRVWIGEEEIYNGTALNGGDTFTVDLPDLFGGQDLGQGGVGGTMRFFDGSATQTASSYLSTFQQQGGDTPAYRGTCYLAPDTEAFYIGNSTSVPPWKFEAQRIPDPLGLGASATVNGSDANLANVAYEILTNTEWGMGIPTADVNSSNFSTAGATLATENNGFSYILDREISLRDLLRLVEEQMGGIVYQNHLTGQYEIALARDDYNIDTVPQVTDSNLHAFENFSRGAWKDTTNQVRTRFSDRDDSYKSTFGLAQDTANIRLQNGVSVITTKNYPGCKDATLANFLAARDLRTLSYPLSKGTLIVDRTFYNTTPGQVLAFTNTSLGLTKLPVRVQRIDLGELDDNKVRLDVVEDVFTSQASSISDPPNSNWVPPVDSLIAFPSDEQLAFEAPRAFVWRDPVTPGTPASKIWAAGRRQGAEVSFYIRERNAVGSPGGSFSTAGQVFSFMRIGSLQSNLPAGSAAPLASMVVTTSPDNQNRIETGILDGLTTADMGSNLRNLIMIGDEFMFVSSAQDSASNVQFSNIYRAALDSVQSDHTAGDDVYLIWLGGGLSDDEIEQGNMVDVKLIPRSTSDEVDESAATTISFTMDERARRPYPPSKITLDSTDWSSSTGLEANGSGGEDFAIDLEILRRDYRTAENGDEIEAILTDAGTLFGDYPAANSTDHQVDVRNDPDGSNTLLFTDTFSGAQHDVLRNSILKATDGVLPTRLRFVLRSRHTDDGTKTSRQELTWDFDVTSSLTGDFNFGALDTNDVANLYTATVAGTYNFSLSSSFTVGNVEYRLNGGSWTTLITAGGTAGSIVGVSISDTIEVRHLSSDSSVTKFLTMTAAGAGQNGYAVLFT